MKCKGAGHQNGTSCSDCELVGNMRIKPEDIKGNYDLKIDIDKIYGLCNGKHDWRYCSECDGYLCNNCDEIK